MNWLRREIRDLAHDDLQRRREVEAMDQLLRVGLAEPREAEISLQKGRRKRSGWGPGDVDSWLFFTAKQVHGIDVQGTITPFREAVLDEISAIKEHLNR